MPQSYKYKAFISYSHKDKKWGNWLHKKLETYRIPKSLVGQTTKAGRISRRLYPIFRDREELPTSNELGTAIKCALEESFFLIVVCSSNAVKSNWVNEEIKYFKTLGRSENILSFIVDESKSTSISTTLAEDFFPKALKYEIDISGNLTSQKTEPIAADARENRDGKKNALIKLIAGLLGVGFDQLKQRDQARNQKKLIGLSILSLILVAIMTGLTTRALSQQIEAEKQKIKAISAQIIAEKAREEESFQRERAELAQKISYRLQREAQWKSYLYQINLANSKIQQGDIITAENILWNTNPKFRNWEWGRLILDADRSLLSVNLHDKEQYFHSGHVESAVFSPDGKQFLAAGSGGQIKISDTATGKILNKIEDGKTIFRKVAFSPDGDIFASSSQNGKVRIWDIESQNELASLKILEDNVEEIVHLSFLKKSKLLVVGTRDGFIRIYNLNGGELIKEYILSNEPLNHVDFSPNETKAVSSHDNGIFKITHLAKGITEIFPVHNENANVFFSVYAPKGGNIFTTNSMRSIIFWDPIKQVISYKSSGQFKNLKTASFSPNGNFLVTACSDGTVQLWDNWRKELVSNTQTHALSLTDIDFHPDNKRYLTSSEDGRVRIWAIQSDNNVVSLETDPYIREVSVSPDNSKVLIVGEGGKKIDFWDTNKSRKVLSFSEIHSAPINHSVFSPCGEKFITSSDDNTSGLWSIKKKKILHLLTNHKSKVNFASFSYDGKLIATASDDKSVLIWDTESAKQMSVLQHNDSVILTSFDPKGEKLITCDINQNTTVWDLNKNKIISTGPKAFNSVTFSPDGKHVLSTSKYSKIAKVWNPDTGKIKYTLKGHLSFLNSAFYSNDGHRIVTTSNDDTIRIWDSKHGDELLSLGFGKCDYAKFFHDGKSLIVHRKFGRERGINVLKALDFSFNQSQYEAHKQKRYLNWQNLKRKIAINK